MSAPHDRTPRPPRTSRSRPSARTALTSGVAALTAAFGLGLSVLARAPQQLPEDLTLGGLDLGGLDRAGARAVLLSGDAVPPPVTLRVGSDTYRVDARDHGWTLDVDRTLDDLFGGGDAEADRLWGALDPAVARSTLNALLAEYTTAPRDAAAVFDKTRYVVRPDVSGARADTDTASRAWSAAPDTTVLDVPIRSVPAARRAADLAPHVAAGNALIRPLELRAGEGRLVLTPAQVANLYWVRPTGIELDGRTIGAAVDRAARTALTPATNARYVNRSGRLVPVAARAGLRVRRAEAVAALTDAVTRPEIRQLSLPTERDAPAIVSATLPDPKALTLLATGRSRYLGSSRERVVNVGVASDRIDGYVVPKGGEFSFLEAVGRIDAAGGFRSALVISGGRTVEGIGGGVCQVSTTAFRALYSAGLPVTQRHQHAYRVRWYEPQVGFEAAVYDPGVDLRLRNDTPGPLLIRTVNDPVRGTLEVRLYGLPTGRKVTVSPAVITSRTPAPAPLTLVNPALKSGQRRQVDWAADGYELYLTRTIRDAAGTRTERLGTRYRPWQAVYEVGPSAAPTKPRVGRPVRSPGG